MFSRSSSTDSPSGRWTAVTTSSSTSLGPISKRTGTPLSSHSLNLKPGLRSSRASSSTRTPASSRSSAMSSAYSRTFVLRVGLPDGDDDDLLGRDGRRQDEALVVGVRHDERTERAPRQPPRGRVGGLFVLVFGRVGEVERLGEGGAEVVGGAGLHGLAVGHERLDGRRRVRAGELVVFRLRAAEHGDGEHVLVERLVLRETSHRLVPRAVAGLVGRVALLPEELLGAEERLRLRGLPANDGGPLVHAEPGGRGGYGPTGPCRAR